MALTALEVDQPWPYPLRGEGMKAMLVPGPEAIGVMLVAAIDRPSAAEISSMRKRPLRLALLPSPPLVWFAIATAGLSFDAPYAIGLHTDTARADRIEAAQQAYSWLEGTRAIVNVALIDQADGRIRALRVVSCSQAWFTVLAAALEASDQVITHAQYANAIARDQARWLTTEDMLAAATIAEIGGR